MTILVTGGAGFIGSNFVRNWLAESDEAIVNLDRLTYAGNRENLASLEGDARHRLIVGGIENGLLVTELLQRYDIRAIINFAAESHVDRSISGPREFIDTNIVGTFALLEAARAHYATLDRAKMASFRFLHVSTDEVFGSLQPNDRAFRETDPYRPNSPYAASKASSDLLVRAYGETYGLPVLRTNCSNNYGPFHFPEKLIPLVIYNALSGKKLPIYGDGQQIRDWLYVGDHCTALRAVLDDGRPKETYNIGGGNEVANIDVVKSICLLLDRLRPRADGKSYAELITFVSDRPGHDRRYAVDASKLRQELGWVPSETFSTGLEKTIRWNLDHTDWVDRVTSGAYRRWVEKQYA